MPVLVQVTLFPAGMLIDPGLNAKSTIRTLLPAWETGTAPTLLDEPGAVYGDPYGIWATSGAAVATR
jgi:hypothetical protein